MKRRSIQTTRDRLVAIFAARPDDVFERADLRRMIDGTQTMISYHLKRLTRDGTIVRTDVGGYRYLVAAPVSDLARPSTGYDGPPIIIGPGEGKSSALLEHLMGTLVNPLAERRHFQAIIERMRARPKCFTQSDIELLLLIVPPRYLTKKDAQLCDDPSAKEMGSSNGRCVRPGYAGCRSGRF
jgi:hypothetical protein